MRPSGRSADDADIAGRMNDATALLHAVAKMTVQPGNSRGLTSRVRMRPLLRQGRKCACLAIR